MHTWAVYFAFLPLATYKDVPLRVVYLFVLRLYVVAFRFVRLRLDVAMQALRLLGLAIGNSYATATEAFVFLRTYRGSFSFLSYQISNDCFLATNRPLLSIILVGGVSALQARS